MVFLDHVQNLHIHAEKTHKDSGAHCMNILILYMVEKTHTGPYYRVQALFMCGVCKWLRRGAQSLDSNSIA